MTFGDRIREEMLAKGIGQELLAEMAGLPEESGQQIINAIINRPQKSSRHASAICSALRLRVDFALSGVGPKYVNDSDSGSNEAIEASSPGNELQALINRATPRSRGMLMRIAQRAASGELSEEDINALFTLSDRLGVKKKDQSKLIKKLREQ